LRISIKIKLDSRRLKGKHLTDVRQFRSQVFSSCNTVKALEKEGERSFEASRLSM